MARKTPGHRYWSWQWYAGQDVTEMWYHQVLMKQVYLGKAYLPLTFVVWLYNFLCQILWYKTNKINWGVLTAAASACVKLLLHAISEVLFELHRLRTNWSTSWIIVFAGPLSRSRNFRQDSKNKMECLQCGWNLYIITSFHDNVQVSCTRA